MLVQLFTNWLKRKWECHLLSNFSFLASNHLKKVVEPPEPYSRTSISGFRIEHINSTPPLSNITVLKAKQGFQDLLVVLKKLSWLFGLCNYRFSSRFDMDKAFQVFTVFSYNVCIVKTDLPMVASNESVRLYSYIHFSSAPISSFFEACCSGPQPSKLAFMLSTSHLFYCTSWL